MDRRARKVEQKRKQREVTKKPSRSGSRRLDPTLVRVAAAASPGTCHLSTGWDDLEAPALVTAVVTRPLPGGRIVAAVAVVDRTCLGIKEAYVPEPMRSSELERFLGGLDGDGMEIVEPLVVQSLVFHALDYADKLGFKPHRDFPETLFGPRPETLSDTPWAASAKPIFRAGPDDDAPAILKQLTAAVGNGKFDHIPYEQAS